MIISTIGENRRCAENNLSQQRRYFDADNGAIRNRTTLTTAL
jgi:hypothetical protein